MRRHALKSFFYTFAAAVIALAAFFAGFAASPAAAHRSGCHRWHTCPSDHATYRWRSPSSGIRWLCVAPYADERTPTFRKRIRYAGRLYYCKR
jgi:hypothetical protein